MSTTQAGFGIGSFALALSESTLVTLATVGAAGVLLAVPLLRYLLVPSHDSREPPLIRPKIPFIGHLISLIKHQNEFHSVLHKANPSMSIATIPILGGKMYTVFDPQLIQAVLRNKAASFDPLVVEFAQKTFGLSNATFAKITSQPTLVPEFTDAVHQSFQSEPLRMMNMHFLSSVSNKLDAIADEHYEVDEKNAGREKMVPVGLEVENLYAWCRDIMSLATTKALYGEGDPFSQDPKLVESIWQLESAIPMFLVSPFPSITMSKGFQARKVLQQTFEKYYKAGHDMTDPTVSRLTANRAGKFHEYGFSAEEIGKMECILPVVATTNAVPTLFWLLVFVLSHPELASQLRCEAEEAAVVLPDLGDGSKIMELDISQFEEKQPLLVSCYRETMRIVNHGLSARRLMEDVRLDAPDGSRTYLLKKGIDIQVSAGVAHGSADIWGPGVTDFSSERFMKRRDKGSGASSAQSERAKRAGYIPFGGGRHLCPGRNLAFCEVVGFMTMLLLKFDLQSLGLEFSNVKMDGSKLSAPSLFNIIGKSSSFVGTFISIAITDDMPGCKKNDTAVYFCIVLSILNLVFYGTVWILRKAREQEVFLEQERIRLANLSSSVAVRGSIKNIQELQDLGI